MERDDEFYDEGDIYSDEAREGMMEDDEIDAIEEGFTQGYEAEDRLTRCALCHVILTDDFIEEDIDGEIYRFCCEEHAEEYKKKNF